MEASEELVISAPLGADIARRRPGGLSVLQHRDFRILCLGLLLASSSIMFQYMAIGQLISDYFPRVLGDSFPVLLMLGMVGLTRGAGVLIFSIVGGAFADRWNRRKIAIWTQIVALAIAGIFTLLILADAIQVWEVFVLLFATAATQSFDWPARQAIIVESVDRSEITSAVSFSTAAMQTSFAISPIFAGSALDLLGVGGAFGMSLIGHASILISLLLISYRGGELVTDTSFLSHVGEGIGYARKHTEILSVLLIGFTVSALASGVIYNLSPFWLPEVLHASALTWGIVAACWGLGAITAAYGLSLARDFRHKGWIFLIGMAGGSAMLIPWAATSSIVAFGLIQFFMGGLLNLGFVTAGAIIQNHVPNEVRGRLTSLLWLNPAFMMLNGAFIGGLAQGVGAETAALGIGVFLTGVMLLAVTSLPRLRRLQ